MTRYYLHLRDFKGDVLEDEEGSGLGTQLAAVPLIAALPSLIVSLLKHPEKVVATDRFEEYRRNADECRSRAENAVDPADKVSWLKLADSWLQIAANRPLAGC